MRMTEADLTTEGCLKKAELVCERMAAWFDKVGLTMNAKKTELIVFRRESGCNVNGISVKGEIIKPSKVIKFLSVHIDSDLGWKSHVKYVAD